jgi:hypothetical protein
MVAIRRALGPSERRLLVAKPFDPLVQVVGVHRRPFAVGVPMA